MGHTFNVILFLVPCIRPQAHTRYLGTTLQVHSSIDASRTRHVKSSILEVYLS